MKKFLFLVVLSVFMVMGCSEDSKDEPIPPTPIDLSNPETLKGTYDIDFFYTNALGQVITNSCDTVASYGFQDEKGKQIKCDPDNNSDSAFTGRGTIDYNADTKELQIITKVQMKGGTYDFFKVYQNGALYYLVEPNQYNYTKFQSIPLTAINSKDKTINAENTVKGVTGRNAKTITPDAALDNEYKFEVDGNTITNYMVDKSSGFLEVPVVVRMKKVSDEVETLNENEAYSYPDISDIFVKDIQQQ